MFAADVRVKAVRLQLHENIDETEDGAEQPQQRRDLRDGGEQIQPLFEAGHFGQCRPPRRPRGHARGPFAVENGRLDEARDGAGRGVADRNGLDNVVALDDRADAVEKLGGIDLRAVTKQHPLDKHDEGGCPGNQNQPDHRAAS